MKTDDYYMNIALKEAKIAYDQEEIPVGAIIVDSLGNIIGKGHNNKEKNNSTIGHAEINAIVSANKKINNWRLVDCTMYVTLEPCEMCKRVINESRLKRVVYCANNSSKQNEITKYEPFSDDKVVEKYQKLLNQSFINIR